MKRWWATHLQTLRIWSSLAKWSKWVWKRGKSDHHALINAKITGANEEGKNEGETHATTVVPTWKIPHQLNNIITQPITNLLLTHHPVIHKINQPVWPTLITLLVSLFRSKHIHAYIRVFKINSFYKFPSGIILQNQILDPMYNQISFFNNNAWYSFIQRKMIRSSVLWKMIPCTLSVIQYAMFIRNWDVYMHFKTDQQAKH